mmetsp:Transcript_42723/g.107442  ORF Transcript_42723/g.107442 Transcript_42723/m.107442 type:complete len:264 (+) Transcript_42723:477-1268(+)
MAFNWFMNTCLSRPPTGTAVRDHDEPCRACRVSTSASCAQCKSTPSSPHADATRGRSACMVRACHLRVASVTQQTLPQPPAAMRKPRAAWSTSFRRTRSSSLKTSSKLRCPSNQARKPGFDMSQVVGQIVSSQSMKKTTFSGSCHSALEVAKEAVETSSTCLLESDERCVEAVPRLPTGEGNLACPELCDSSVVLAKLMRRACAAVHRDFRCATGPSFSGSSQYSTGSSCRALWWASPEGWPMLHMAPPAVSLQLHGGRGSGV